MSLEQEGGRRWLNQTHLLEEKKMEGKFQQQKKKQGVGNILDNMLSFSLMKKFY